VPVVVDGDGGRGRREAMGCLLTTPKSSVGVFRHSIWVWPVDNSSYQCQFIIFTWSYGAVVRAFTH
jgi:hypothetical protein